MKKGLLVVLASIFMTSVFGQNSWKHGQLKTTANGHYLQYEDGTPFFWLGDTAWELFHRLQLDEINKYLDNRQKKGFNVIQAVVLAEFDGLKKPNQYGDVPLLNLDPSTPNEKYFQLVDTVVKMASSKGLYMGLLPTWGDNVTKLWGEGPAVFNAENAYKYGLWIGKRYKDCPNIIWILGGDQPPMNEDNDWRPVWRAMAKGILEGTANKALISYHISGGEMSTSQYIHNEYWLHINMIQSGHGSGHDTPIWALIQRDWSLLPTKPVLDAEPNYEDHPVNPWPTWNPENGYFRDYDVRKQTYRSVFAGACGVTYGHHSVWQFWSPREEKINHADRYWPEAIDRPGAFQVGYLRMLIESRPQLNRIPDQSMIEKGQGEKGEYICAFRDKIGSYMMMYIPFGKTITVNTSSIKSKKLNVWWFNPKTGTSKNIGLINNKVSVVLTTPSLGFENDWVLIIDNPKYKYCKPNMKK
ncbi:MAG TPA: glycoside hydrolase family 140 protein [Bacteroidales bacterium]